MNQTAIDFYIGTSPKDIYMIPDKANVMVNASQFWDAGRFRAGRETTAYRRLGKVFLDSGGYVFFSHHGRYPFTIRQYIQFVTYFQPDYFATMDYPCEPSISSALGRDPIEQRQQMTVEAAAAILKYFQADIKPRPIPVIQGYTAEQYRTCIDMHREAGTIRPYMAVGSLCTRSSTVEIGRLLAEIQPYAARNGIKQLHLFGIKQAARIKNVAGVASIDSAAIYFAGNRKIKAEWGGKRFAPTRAAKQQALTRWLDRAEQNNLQWKTEPPP